MDSDSLSDNAQMYQDELDESASSDEHIDRKRSDRGRHYYVETVEEDIPQQINWNDKYALCVVRHMTSGTRPYVDRVALQVNSPHLKSILKDVIGNKYPGQSFLTKNIEINAPYRALFHWRHELEDAGQDLAPESDEAKHHQLLVDFINEQFADVIEESNNLLPEGRVTYENLWTIFRPSSLVFSSVMGQPRAFELTEYSYSHRPPCLNLSVSYVNFDGSRFGTAHKALQVEAFAGTERIDSLEALPFEHHRDSIALKQQLIKRGNRWESFAGMHIACYTGVGIEGINRYMIDGRVVVDTATFHRINNNLSFSVSPFPGSAKEKKKRQPGGSQHPVMVKDQNEETATGNDRFDPLTDHQLLLATCMVRGFSFTEKKWVDMFVDFLSPVDWNKQCFDQLVLPQDQKELVKALVATHTGGQNNFDDIVKHKGRGLIMVLHGPPGVGKTLTAETVAEYSQRPLYTVSSGDLGTETSGLDGKLSRILDLASTWKAVLLIDEADVFLESRSLHDMERNCLVSIFLRVLEYYEGILFLTTNRVNTFDDAFKSRIQVPIKYNDLTPASRTKIWKNFLAPMQDSANIAESGYRELAQSNLNGRQIKNVIRTAKSLAQFHNEKLDVSKLLQVINIQMDFERELNRPGTASNGVANGVDGSHD